MNKPKDFFLIYHSIYFLLQSHQCVTATQRKKRGVSDSSSLVVEVMRIILRLFWNVKLSVLILVLYNPTLESLESCIPVKKARENMSAVKSE